MVATCCEYAEGLRHLKAAVRKIWPDQNPDKILRFYQEIVQYQGKRIVVSSGGLPQDRKMKMIVQDFETQCGSSCHQKTARLFFIRHYGHALCSFCLNLLVNGNQIDKTLCMTGVCATVTVAKFAHFSPKVSNAIYWDACIC